MNHVAPFAAALSAALLMALGGCENQPAPDPIKPAGSVDLNAADAPQAPTPDDAQTNGAQPDAAQPNAAQVYQPTRSRALEGTPHDHLDGTLTLKYEGPSGDFDLFRTPGDRNSISGKAPLKSGMEIDVRRSQVFVTKPRTLLANRDLDMIATRWDRLASKSGTDDVVHIANGQAVNLLKSAGDGHCWLSIAGDDFKAGCPSPDDFAAEGWNGDPNPVELEWWVKTAVSGAQGWLPVDDISFSWSVKPKKRR